MTKPFYEYPKMVLGTRVANRQEEKAVIASTPQWREMNGAGLIFALPPPPKRKRRMSEDYQRWPLTMSHPAFENSVITPTDPGKPFTAYRGTPTKFPPVTALSQTEEDYYASQGYEPAGKIDPSAWVRQHASPAPADYQPEKYPMWSEKLGKVLMSAKDDPDATEEDLADADAPPIPPPQMVAPVDGEAANLRAQLEALQAQMAKMLADKQKAERPLAHRQKRPYKRRAKVEAP